MNIPGRNILELVLNGAQSTKFPKKEVHPYFLRSMSQSII